MSTNQVIEVKIPQVQLPMQSSVQSLVQSSVQQQSVLTLTDQTSEHKQTRLEEFIKLNEQTPQNFQDVPTIFGLPKPMPIIQCDYFMSNFQVELDNIGNTCLTPTYNHYGASNIYTSKQYPNLIWKNVKSEYLYDEEFRAIYILFKDGAYNPNIISYILKYINSKFNALLPSQKLKQKLDSKMNVDTKTAKVINTSVNVEIDTEFNHSLHMNFQDPTFQNLITPVNGNVDVDNKLGKIIKTEAEGKHWFVFPRYCCSLISFIDDLLVYKQQLKARKSSSQVNNAFSNSNSSSNSSSSSSSSTLKQPCSCGQVNCDALLTEVEIIHIALQLCFALYHCYKQRVVHRDVKFDNIFIQVPGLDNLIKVVKKPRVQVDINTAGLTTTQEVKNEVKELEQDDVWLTMLNLLQCRIVLADFGCAEVIRNQDKLQVYYGYSDMILGWKKTHPPEVRYASYRNYINYEKCDVFGLGQVIVGLMGFLIRGEKFNVDNLLDQVKKQVSKYHYSQGLWILVEGLLQEDFSKRWSIANAYNYLLHLAQVRFQDFRGQYDELAFLRSGKQININNNINNPNNTRTINVKELFNDLSTVEIVENDNKPGKYPKCMQCGEVWSLTRWRKQCKICQMYLCWSCSNHGKCRICRLFKKNPNILSLGANQSIYELPHRKLV